MKYLSPGNLLNSFDKDSLMKMMPTRAAKASSVNLTQKSLVGSIFGGSSISYLVKYLTIAEPSTATMIIQKNDAQSPIQSRIVR